MSPQHQATSTSVEARRRAIAELIAQGSDPTALVETLRDPDWRVREEAIVRIRTFRAKETLVPALIAALSDTSDIAFRNAAAAGLVMVGSACLTLLQHATSAMDADARKLVAEICAQIPTASAVSILLRFAMDRDENVRIAAFEGLAQARYAGPDLALEASALLLREAKVAGLPLRLAALETLHALGTPISDAELRAWVDDPLVGPHAARAASGSTDADVLDRLASLASRDDEVGFAAIRALASSLAADRGAVFFAVTRHGAALCRALEAAIATADATTGAAALDLLPALFRPEHLALYLEQLGAEASADAASRGLIALAPMVGGYLLSRVEYMDSPNLPTAARLVAPLLDETSALALSRRLLSSPPQFLEDLWLELMLALPAWDCHVSWERAFDATNHEMSARHACELLATRASREPSWAREELARVSLGEVRPRLRSALLLGVARSEPLSPSEARDVEVGIGSEDALVREWSLLAAAHGAAVDRRTVIAALADEANQVALAAVIAAARTGCVVEIEELALATSDARVLIAAVSALSSVAPEHALDVALRRLATSDERLAAAALSRVPATSPRLLEACEVAMRRGETPVVLAALRLLVAADDPRASLVVAQLLQHERWEVRALAAAGLPVAKFRDALLARLEREDNTQVADAIRQNLLRA